MSPLLPIPTRYAPIFLHTGWRSRGTWIWSALRRDPRAMAFYEPLHEVLTTLTPAAIDIMRPESWASGHESMSPYWAEYRPLLRRGSAGMPGAREEFGVDQAFQAPTASSPDLADLIARLLDHAEASGHVPVLKFCRSLGRVTWMRATFPEAQHIVLLRRPDAQWASARLQCEAHGNPYFVLMPLLVLARNATDPVVARICRVLRAPVLRLRRDTLAGDLELCQRQARQLTWEDRYRGFLAYWLAGIVSALAADVRVVDSDMLVWSQPYRTDLAATVALRSGLKLELGCDPSHTTTTPPRPLERDAAAAHRDALALLQEQRTSLRPEGYVLAWNQLAAGLVTPGELAELANEVQAAATNPALPRPVSRAPWVRWSGRPTSL